MSSLDSWRKIPHPTYGHYGGVSNHGFNHTLIPIDELDLQFKIHDQTLLYNYDKPSRALADLHLLKSLYKVHNQEIGKPIYGRFYKYGCIAIFSIIVSIHKFKGDL